MASPRRRDPTATLTLRLWAVRQVNRRFKSIRRAVIQTLVGNDALSVDGGGVSANAVPATRARFVYLRDAAKVEEFGRWVAEQVTSDVFDGHLAARSTPSDFWLRTAAKTAYGRGAAKAQQRVLRFYANDPAAAALAGRSIYASAAHAERAELIYTRMFEKLRGVTAQMEAQMRGVLSDGVIKGLSPNLIAENLADRIDKIGMTRARLISRTEIVNAHNFASISASKDLERSIEGAEVKLKWVTALDGRERPSHRARNGKIYSQKEASQLIGEPNCRCSVSAWLPQFEE